VSVAFNVENTSRAKRNKIDELMFWTLSEDLWIRENVFNSDWISDKQLLLLHLAWKLARRGRINGKDSTHSKARPKPNNVSIFCEPSQCNLASGKAQHEIDHVS
jgi:hypothetical protein